MQPLPEVLLLDVTPQQLEDHLLLLQDHLPSLGRLQLSVLVAGDRPFEVVVFKQEVPLVDRGVVGVGAYCVFGEDILDLNLSMRVFVMIDVDIG